MAKNIPKEVSDELGKIDRGIYEGYIEYKPSLQEGTEGIHPDIKLAMANLENDLPDFKPKAKP